jgi:ABC-type multidrug transport system fused ATPase/permease subunit
MLSVTAPKTTRTAAATTRLFRRSIAAATRSSRWSHYHQNGRFSAIRTYAGMSSQDEDGKENSKEMKKTAKEQFRIAKTLTQHVWPLNETNDPDVVLRKRRVAASLGLMLAGKAVTIQVPFLFKHLVDALPSTDAAALAASDPMAAASGLPVALLLGYGISRAASSGLQEWRNAVFAHVAQDAIRNVGRTVFDHVHKLDMQFHLSRNTGQLSRVLDRGQRSIAFILNAMVFHAFPTLLEVSLVTGLMVSHIKLRERYPFECL